MNRISRRKRVSSYLQQDLLADEVESEKFKDTDKEKDGLSEDESTVPAGQKRLSSKTYDESTEEVS